MYSPVGVTSSGTVVPGGSAATFINSSNWASISRSFPPGQRHIRVAGGIVHDRADHFRPDHGRHGRNIERPGGEPALQRLVAADPNFVPVTVTAVSSGNAVRVQRGLQ